MAENENIKVAVRVRPFTELEVEEESECVVHMEGAETTLLTLPPKKFAFDYSYWSFSQSDSHYVDQDVVMRDIGVEILKNALQGYNGCLFAYGQTGSGKTFSVLGSDKHPGIIPRTVDRLFTEKVGIERDLSKELRIWASYLEIYNEHLRDLLKPGDDADDRKQKDLVVTEHPKYGMVVPGLSEEPCTTASEVNARFVFGQKKRAVGATRMNSQSSRSHTVFCLRVEFLDGAQPPAGAKDSRQALSAKINLIDLAGSERLAKTQAEGVRMREGCAINKSLSALGMIIKELSEANQDSNRGRVQATLPFRTSKLTFLLKDSLAGNSKTFMMAAISPAHRNAQETLSTLRFASSVKAIKTQAKQNKHSKAGIIAELKREVEELKAQNEQLVKNGASSDHLKTNATSMLTTTMLLDSLAPDYSEQVQQALEMDRRRIDTMEDGALSREEITNMFGVSAQTPYLLNVADDPALAGSLIYYIGEGAKLTIGSAPDNGIQLVGIGIGESLCLIENRGKSEIYITKCCKEGRLVVDGRPMEADQALKLRHGQSLFFGRDHGFKLCKPGFEDEGGRFKVMNELWEGVQMENPNFKLEHSPAFVEVEAVTKRALERVNAEYGKELLERINTACRACDEANEITEHCRPEIGIRFQVTMTSPDIFPPDVVVRAIGESADYMMRPSMAQTFEKSEYKQLFCMNTAELLERLDRMYEICNAQHVGVPEDATPWEWLADPWQDVTHVDAMHHIMSLEMRLAYQDELLKRLEAENHSLRATGRRLSAASAGACCAKTFDDLCKDVQATDTSMEGQKLVDALSYAKHLMDESNTPSRSPSKQANGIRGQYALFSGCGSQPLSPQTPSMPQSLSPETLTCGYSSLSYVSPARSRHASPSRYSTGMRLGQRAPLNGGFLSAHIPVSPVSRVTASAVTPATRLL